MASRLILIVAVLAFGAAACSENQKPAPTPTGTSEPVQSPDPTDNPDPGAGLVEDVAEEVALGNVDALVERVLLITADCVNLPGNFCDHGPQVRYLPGSICDEDPTHESILESSFEEFAASASKSHVHAAWRIPSGTYPAGSPLDQTYEILWDNSSGLILNEEGEITFKKRGCGPLAEAVQQIPSDAEFLVAPPR